MASNDKTRQQCWLFHTTFNKMPTYLYKKLVQDIQRNEDNIEYAKVIIEKDLKKFNMDGFVKWNKSVRESTLQKEFFHTIKTKVTIKPASNDQEELKEQSEVRSDNTEEEYIQGEFKTRGMKVALSYPNAQFRGPQKQAAEKQDRMDEVERIIRESNSLGEVLKKVISDPDLRPYYKQAK